MYCSNCGAEVTGKFCSNCGALIAEKETSSAASGYADHIQMLCTSGHKIELIKVIREQYNMGLREAKDLADKLCANPQKVVQLLGEQHPEVLVWKLNGHDVDVIKFVSMFGTESTKESRNYLSTLTGAGMFDIASFIGKLRGSAQVKMYLQHDAKKLKEQGKFFCPKCHSTNIQINKNGYGWGKGAVGVLLVGPLGLLAGGMGANKLQATCLNCGHKFSISK